MTEQMLTHNILAHPKVKEYLRLLKGGMLKFEAAERAGLSYRTIQRYRAASSEFKEHEEEVMGRAVEKVEKVLYQAALDGEPWAVTKFLDGHARSTYKPAKELRVSGEIEHTHTHTVRTPAQLAELRQELEARREAVQGEAPQPTADEDDDEIYDAEVVE